VIGEFVEARQIGQLLSRFEQRLEIRVNGYPIARVGAGEKSWFGRVVGMPNSRIQLLPLFRILLHRPAL